MTVADLIARLEQLPPDLPVTMPAAEDESDFCYVAEAFEDLMCVMPGSGLSLCDEGDKKYFTVVRLFGASDTASA